MRATAQDPEAARLMGINVDTTISLTFLLGGMLAGAAGLIYALYQTTIWYFQGFTAGLIAFTAAVMGGIGNLQGAVLGGLIIGCIQQISDNRIGAAVDDRGRVRLPRPDHGLPAAGAHRRGDEGGGMSTPRLRRELVGRGREHRRRARGRRAVVLLAILLPLVHDPLANFIDNCVTALRLRRHGARAEHRRRLRRPARPRLRRLLRDRRVHDRLVRAPSFFADVNHEKGIHVVVGDVRVARCPAST